MGERDMKDVMKEVEILSSLKHENILELEDFYDEDDCLFIITKKYSMDLLDYINVFYDKLTETKIKFIFK